MKLFASAFVTILVVMDPVGNVPVFLSLTRDQRPAQQHRASLQATAVAASVVYGFALFGQEVLHLLGISVAALEVAGGLILGAAALELLHPPAAGQGRLPGTANVAFVPLGTPLLAGPGAIAATMVYVRRAQGVAEVFTVLGALAAVLVILYLALRFSGVLSRLLRDNGIELVSRIVGLLLAAIAVQLIATGAQFWALHGV
ncbi:MAG TPA: MarC family protein [Acidimicrobiales bacterium]|nr:MarC family protein [Acidimicrobiales bacterium]